MFPNRSDKKRAVKSQMIAGGLNCQISETDDCTIYVTVVKTKALVMRGYCATDLCLCFRTQKIRFSHDAANILMCFLTCLCFRVKNLSGPKIHPTKKKLNSNIVPLSSPFNAKMFIVITY